MKNRKKDCRIKNRGEKREGINKKEATREKEGKERGKSGR